MLISRIVFTLGALSALLGDLAQANTVFNCFPKTKLGLNDIIFQPQAQINEEEAQNIFNKLHSIFSPDMARMGGTLHFMETDNMEFSAYAWARGNNERVVEMYKGTRFHPLINPDTYALVACHELGHHLGGLPIKQGSWGSVEGAADYYANLKCMRRYFENLTTVTSTRSPSLLSVVDHCQKSFPQIRDFEICLRSLGASYRLVAILVENNNAGQAIPTFEQHDTSIAKVTLEQHPPPQCRLDTYSAGALCPVPWTQPLSYFSPVEGACGPHLEPEYGRPACWFASPMDHPIQAVTSTSLPGHSM